LLVAIPKENAIAIQTIAFELCLISISLLHWYWTQFSAKPLNIYIQTHPRCFFKRE
jgi:hypothetical protein